MKRIGFITTPLVIVMLILGTFSVAIAAPPTLPSSFFGAVQFQSGDGAPVAGAVLNAYVPGVTEAVASTTLQTSSGLVYSINVPADTDGSATPSKDGGIAGDVVTFMIGTRIVATGTWASGTNVLLNIHPPEAVSGGPYTGSVGNSVSISGSGSDSDSDIVSYTWDLDNDGAYDDASTASTSKTWSSVGVYPIGLKVVDDQGGIGTSATTVTISAGAATFAITNLAHTYDGTQKYATIVPTPSSVTYTVTYGGSGTAPSAAGSYAIVVTSTDPNYAGSDSSKTLEIAKADSSTAVSGGGSYVYDGSSHPATVSVTGAGSLSLTPAPVYSGSCSAAPINVADTPCTASYSFIGDANHNSSSDTTTITITKAPATSVTLSNLSQVYDGTQKSATVTTVPASLPYTITYDDVATVPTNAGSYTVAVTLTSPNYSGSASGTLVITKAPAIITLANLEQVFGSVTAVTATTDPIGLPVTIIYNGESTLPTVPGSYAVSASVNTANYTGTQSGTLIIHAKHDIALVEGWNLVSFNLIPTSTVITSVLASVDGNYDLVYAWDSTVASDNWLKYDPTAALYSNNLTALLPTQGFWIHMTEADTLEVVGDAPTSTTIALNSTADGWNLVGFPAGTDGTLPGILTSHGVGATDYSLLYSYRAADSSDPWKLYDRTGESYANDLSALQPGWGYWIKVSSAQSWSLPY